MITQIYEITTIEDALGINSAGVDHAGMWVSLNPPPNRSALTLERASEIIDVLSGAIKPTVLILTTKLNEVDLIIQELKPAILHIGSSPSVFTLDMTKQLKDRHPNTPIMSSIPVQDARDIDLAISFSEVADFLLLDTYDPGQRNFGCTGKIHNWEISRQIVEAVSTPVILAGGLGSDNVAEAIKKVRPAGVDSKTKTDMLGSYRKDLRAVAEFVTISKSVM